MILESLRFFSREMLAYIHISNASTHTHKDLRVPSPTNGKITHPSIVEKRLNSITHVMEYYSAVIQNKTDPYVVT